MFTLAIVGRPNVGKSTLFNLIAGKKLAIVDDRPGVTRDWRDATGELMGYPLRIIDTAGLEESFDDSIQGRMRRQTELGIKQADAVLFLIDGRAGLTPLDEHFASWLRKQRIPVIVGVNKCESEKATIAAVAEAHKLGFGEPVPMAAAHGQGLDLLLDALKPHLPEEEISEETEEDEESFSESFFDTVEGDEDFDFSAQEPPEEAEEEKPIKLAIVGRPNVGKSTLLNALIGEERVMTGAEAGTTRDAIAVQWEFNGRKIRLVDTAGLRRKARIEDPIEKMATQDTLRAIRLAQVVIMVIDGNLGLEKQDLTIAQHVLDEGRALIIAANKWDSVEDKKKSLQQIQDRMLASLAQVRNLPLLTISALRGSNLDPLMSSVLAVYRLWNRRAPTARMNRWLADMESQNPPPASDGRANRLKYITQIKSRPPTFAVWTSRPSDLPDTYKRYLINGLREDFDMEGIPVRLVVRASKNPYADKD